MAKKKYTIRSFKPNSEEHKHVNPLINLSSLGISKNTNIMKASLAMSNTESQMESGLDGTYTNMYSAMGAEYLFTKFRDLTKNQTNNYAYYDQSYVMRRMACREMSRDNEIAFLINTICNEGLVKDNNGYIAQLDVDKLKLFLNKSYNNTETNTNADTLIRDVKISYQIIYSNLGWDDNDGAYQTLFKYLTDGFIAMEILVDHNARTVIGFLELDPATLEPAIEMLEDGTQVFVWYQFRGDATRERKIPDSNIIYISWNGHSSFRTNNISYVESLTRSYHMLRSLENSQLIWNIQNAQKRMKITIPIGDLPTAKAEAKVQEIMAAYLEEVSIDDASGQMLVNGQPKFPFTKTYFFEDREGSSINMEAVDTGGYELSTSALQYFWRKFILESQVPANRFTMDISAAPTNQFIGDANVTREEYAFGRFIQRIQSSFKEILLKPLWMQLCLKHPELSKSNYLKGGLGIKFNEENIFTLAKKRTLVNEGAGTVSTLMGITVDGEKPYFSIEFLIKEYLGLTEQQLEINRKYIEGDIEKKIKAAKLQKKHADDLLMQTPENGVPTAEGGDFGGGGFGGGPDVMSGGEFGGPSGGSNPEPNDDGGF